MTDAQSYRVIVESVRALAGHQVVAFGDAWIALTNLKVNRPLSKNEQQHRLSIKESCSTKPHYELSLIKLNSTYVESVDKWFSMRGWVAMGGGLGSVLIAVLLISSLIDALLEWHPAQPVHPLQTPPALQ